MRFEQDFMAVPKKSKRAAAKSDFCWRLSFLKQEDDILKNRGCAKPVIKLLKVKELTTDLRIHLTF